MFIILSPASPPPLPAPLGQIIALLCAHHLSHHLHHMLSYPRFATLYSPLLVENIRMLLAVPCLVAIAGVCVCSVLRGTLRSNTIQNFFHFVFRMVFVRVSIPYVQYTYIHSFLPTCLFHNQCNLVKGFRLPSPGCCIMKCNAVP